MVGSDRDSLELRRPPSVLASTSTDTLRARGATVESSFLLTCSTGTQRVSPTGSSTSDLVEARPRWASA